MGAFTTGLKLRARRHNGAADASSVFASLIITSLAFLSLILTIATNELNPIPLMLSAWGFILLLWSPKSFEKPYRVWKIFWLGLSQLIIMLVWVCYILPAGIIMQARGRDPLHLRFQPSARTYWKKPHPTGNMMKST